MLAELVDRLTEIGQKSQEVKFHTHPQAPGKAWLQEAGQPLKEIYFPAPERKHQLLGFDDLVAALRDPTIAPNPEVYVNGQKIVALLDRNDRRQTVEVALAYTSRLKLCRQLEQQPANAPAAQIVKMLRFDLHGGQHAPIIDALSVLTWTRSSTTDARTAHGTDGYGRSVDSVVKQADTVPKEFEIAVPVWANEGFSRYSANVVCGVFLDTEKQTVELRVLSDEVMRVVNGALTALAADLRAAVAKVPVFLGAPA